MRIAEPADEDLVEVSVTHEIKINGDKAWVGTRYTTKVRSNETPDEAHDRADAEVQRMVIKSIQSTVTTVEEFTS